MFAGFVVILEQKVLDGVRQGAITLAFRPFKRNVRKLKSLGLTESLEVGYRLSPRGKLFLDRLEDSASTSDA